MESDSAPMMVLDHSQITADETPLPRPLAQGALIESSDFSDLDDTEEIVVRP